MKKLVAVFVGSLFSLSAHAGFVQTGCDPNLASQQKVVQAKLGDNIIIFAPGNPTTGYGWISKEGIESTYSDMSRGRIGGGGAYQFVVEATSALDNNELTFEYKRSWERGKPASTCKVKVLVD